MVERAVNNNLRPNIDPNVYTTRVKITINAPVTGVFEYLQQRLKEGTAWPGFKPKILKRLGGDSGIPSIIEFKEKSTSTEKEPNRFQIEMVDGQWIDDSKPDSKIINWKIRNFDLTYQLGELGYVNITNDDLSGSVIDMTQKVRKIDSDEDKPISLYEISFKISNCKVRNVAHEALDLFREISQDHIEEVRKNFTGFFNSIGDFVNKVKMAAPEIAQSLDLAS